MAILNDNYWEASIELPGEWWIGMMGSAFDQLTNWTATIGNDDWHYSSSNGTMYFRFSADATAFRLRFAI